MADDEDRASGGPEELFTPSGPRRSNFTPPTNDAETLEAAASVFNDDAIAAALAAELARVASGPIQVVRPPAQDAATPAVSPQQPAREEPPSAPPIVPAPVSAQPVAVPPVVPEPVASQPTEVPPPAPTTEPPLSTRPVASDPSPEPPVWSLATDEPAPAAAAPEPGTPSFDLPAPESSPFGASPFDIPSFEVPPQPSAPSVTYALDDEPLGQRDPASVFFGTPAADFVPTSAQPPTDAPADASQPWLPAPQVDATPVDQPPPYLGAPAPTVPAADAPPPPGYVPPPATQPPSAEPLPSMQNPPLQDQPVAAPFAEPFGEPLQASADVAPSAPPGIRPRRRSLADDELLRNLHGEDTADNTLSAIEQLQAELQLRAEEAREYAAWEQSMLADGSPESLAAVEQARAELAGNGGSPSAPEPAAPSVPATAPEPIPPTFPGTAPEPIPPTAAAAPVAAPPAAPSTPESGARFSEPASTGSAFDDLFARLSPSATPVPAPSDSPAAIPDFPGFSASGDSDAGPMAANLAGPDQFAAPSPAEPPQPVEPSLANFALPTDFPVSEVPPPTDAPISDVPPPIDDPVPDVAPPAAPGLVPATPDAPVFLEPPTLIEPPTLRNAGAEVPADLGAYPPAQAMWAPTAAPPPAAAPSGSDAAPAAAQPTPSGNFESLLTGGDREENPNAQPSSWLPPGSNPLPQPDPLPEASPEAETESHRPFGEGVERDDAVDPTDSVLDAASTPVRVDTAGVAVVDESLLAQSQSIPVQRAEPLPPVVELRAPAALSTEVVGAEPTPLDQRVGRASRLFWLWFAPNSSIVAVVFGGMIFSLGMSLRQAIVATLAGVALSILPLGLGTLAGKRSGQPTMIVSRATFGVVGNILPAIIAFLSRLFWAAALLWLLGAGAANILTGAQLTDGFTPQELTMIVMVVGFILAIIVAWFGYGLIAQVQRVVSILSAVFVIGFIALTAQYVSIQTALTIGDGPWVLAATGAVLVFSFVGLVWANSGAELARYQRAGSSGASSMLWATFGAALPSFVLIAYGALLASSDSRIAAGLAVNPLDTLGRLLPVWYPAPLLLATGLSLLSGTVIAMYSGGFTLQAIGVRVRRSLATLIVGALVLAIALVLATSLSDFTQLFRDCATTLAVPVAAWAGMFAAELMIRNRRFDAASLLRRGGVYADARWSNLIGLVLISVIGFGLTSATVPWLSWQGFLFPLLGVATSSDLAATDLGVLVAIVLGLLFPIIAGVPAIRRQEKAERPAE